MPLAARRPVAVALSTSMRSSHHDNHFDDDAALDRALATTEEDGARAADDAPASRPPKWASEPWLVRVLLNNGEVMEPFCKHSCQPSIDSCRGIFFNDFPIISKPVLDLNPRCHHDPSARSAVSARTHQTCHSISFAVTGLHKSSASPHKGVKTRTWLGSKGVHTRNGSSGFLFKCV